MCLDSVVQDLDVPGLVLRTETDNWWRFSRSLQMLHLIERLNITSQVAAYLSAACLPGPVALTADIIASHWGSAKFYSRFLFWISFLFILTFHCGASKHGTVKAAILVLQNNKMAAVCLEFIITFFLCKNFPLFQEICKDATYLVSKITHVASSFVNLLFKFWLWRVLPS